MNMLNCCNVEIQFLPIETSTMLVLIPNGKFLIDFGKMLRTDDKCYSFTVENVNMYCKGEISKYSYGRIIAPPFV